MGVWHMANESRRLSNDDKLSVIYHRYKDLMHHIAFDVLRDYHIAEDAVSLALYRISENLDSIDDAESTQSKNYVSLITKNVAIDMYRKRAKMDVISLDALVTDFSGAAEPYVGPHEYTDFSRLLDQLSEEYRKAFILRFGEGYTNKEIAQIMHCSEAKAAKLVTRAREKLKQIIANEQYEEDS